MTKEPAVPAPEPTALTVVHSPKPAWPALLAGGLWDSTRTTQHSTVVPAKWAGRFVSARSKNAGNCKPDSLKVQDLMSTPRVVIFPPISPLCTASPGVLFSYFKPSSDIKAFETTSFISLIISKSSLYFQISVPLTHSCLFLECTLKSIPKVCHHSTLPEQYAEHF